jgi:hypothetical protein
MKGLKMRISGFGGKVLERLGSVPQNIPGGEIYTALEKGTIDAAEWVGPYDDFKLGFYKVAPWYGYPGWWEGGPQLSLYVNTKAWDALSADYKAIVEACASHAHVNMVAAYDAKNPAALKQLVAGGAKLFRFPKDVMEGPSPAVYAELDGPTGLEEDLHDFNCSTIRGRAIPKKEKLLALALVAEEKPAVLRPRAFLYQQDRYFFASRSISRLIASIGSSWAGLASVGAPEGAAPGIRSLAGSDGA